MRCKRKPPADTCCGSLLQSAPHDAPVDPRLPRLQSLQALAHEAAAAPQVRSCN